MGESLKSMSSFMASMPLLPVAMNMRPSLRCITSVIAFPARLSFFLPSRSSSLKRLFMMLALLMVPIASPFVVAQTILLLRVMSSRFTRHLPLLNVPLPMKLIHSGAGASGSGMHITPSPKVASHRWWFTSSSIW